MACESNNLYSEDVDQPWNDGLDCGWCRPGTNSLSSRYISWSIEHSIAQLHHQQNKHQQGPRFTILRYAITQIWCIHSLSGMGVAIQWNPLSILRKQKTENIPSLPHSSITMRKLPLRSMTPHKPTPQRSHHKSTASPAR